LSEFFPENSFVEIDIENPNIHKQIREVISSNRREENIEAIAEARRRLLNEYQIWPTVQNHIMDV
jgi:ABC-type oligopeptide transport system substrate-binding subunit